MRFLAQTPILPLDGASPIELTRAAFGVRRRSEGWSLRRSGIRLSGSAWARQDSLPALGAARS